MIPNEVIDKILDKTDIVEIISAYITLKKAGQNFRARCPFHEEKTPSFMVSPAKQIYHCFGCAAGGNAIGFLMNHEKMDFIEALKVLADKTGVSLPNFGGNQNTKTTLADKLYTVNDLTCSLYQKNLTDESGKRAYKYFIDRGLNDRTIKLFRLGFAQDIWQGLIHHSKSKNIDIALLEKAGLVLKAEQSGNWYDRFRNRIIFPILNIRGKILGFGGRALDESLPKYMNSPETNIYTKGKHLYGMNFSKQYIKKQDYAIIVEGYFDLILPFQNEIRNIVATLGTALTTEQIINLKRFTKNVIMVYDSDTAGEEATLRSLDILIEEDMNVRIAILPKGTDPDSFVRKEGRVGFIKILKESKDIFDYKLGRLTSRFTKDQPRGKARIVAGMLPTLAKIKNAVLKSSYLKRMSEELSVDEESIRSELKKVKMGPVDTYRAQTESKEKKSESIAEMALLAIVLEDADPVKMIKKDLGFEKFKDRTIASILERVYELHKSGKEIIPSHLMGYFEDYNSERIISDAMNMTETIKNKNKVIEDCFRHIRKSHLRFTLNSIQYKIKAAETAKDGTKINQLIIQYNDLIKEMAKRTA